MDKLKNSTQSGVTLLLSTLILAAITAVAFSVATLALVEVKSSSDATRTDTAYYNDQGIAEDAIFVFKRGVASEKSKYGSYSSGQFCSGLSGAIQGPDAGISSRSRRCLVRSSNIVQSRVPVSANSYQSGVKFFLYDPSFLAPGNQPGGYKKIRLTHISGQMTIFICRLDVLCDESIGGFEFGTPTSFSTGVREYSSLDVSKSYEIVIKNNSAVTEAEFQLETFGPDNFTPKGLPYVNKESVEIESTRGSLTRRVEVLVPTQ